MKISATFIVKDDSELETFKQSVSSVIPFVDTWHVVANGKETTEIEAYTRSQGGDYHYLAWNEDFSEQRNFIFSKVPSDTDYIWWQDADDVLVGGEHLRDCATTAKKNGKDVVFFAYWYGCSFEGTPSLETFKEVDIEHYRERLIKPGTIAWKGRLHETPVPMDGQKNNYTKFTFHKEKTPIAVMHLATIDEAYVKMERNKRILELQLEEEKENGEADPRTLLYLMKIYAEEVNPDRWKQCIKMGQEYLKKSGWDEERANCCDLMAICYTKLEDYPNAISFLHKAIEEYPHQPLHYIRLALAYYNSNKFRQAKHWLQVVSQLDMDSQTAGISNLKELKVLLAQLLLKIRYNVDKDLPGAVEAAKALYREQPIEGNHENLLFLMDLLDLQDASESSKKVLDYLEDIGANSNITKVLDALPIQISEQPWAISKRRKVTPPRKWKDNEICYFANFGGKHFEKWDSKSLQKGIGGSETAVIELAKEWTELGYKVTVYGDPEYLGEQGGVTYLPWYYFNRGDKFNIFIQWRGASLAPVVKAQKFYVDLHDVVTQVDYSKEIMNAIDGVFFKSEYHRKMLPSLPDEKALIVGNGIRV
jgi:tetratricopeptide (TPR) repeat protein